MTPHSDATPPEPPTPGILPPPDKLFWGMQELPFSEATKHFLILGSPGSGKTTLVDLLMRSVLRHVGAPGFNHRALLYDAKGDSLPTLARMGFQIASTPVSGGVLTLNPFDRRCFAWDMARDIDSPAAAMQLAATLIPAEEQATQRYFTDAARHLLYGVLLSFIAKAPGSWTLRDVVLAMSDPDQLLAVLAQTAASKEIGNLYTKSEHTFNLVFSTMVTKLQPLEIVAALWNCAAKEGRTVSLTDWVHGNFILVLGTHCENDVAMQLINQAIFCRLTDLILGSPDDPERGVNGRKSWLFLDDVPWAGKLEGLVSLLNEARSKGVCTVLSLQQIGSLRDTYKTDEAHEILGLCGNKTILHIGDLASAKWAEAHFGKCPDSTSQPPGHQNLRPAVHASEFMRIPMPNPQTGITGFHDIPLLGAYWRSITWGEIESRRRGPLPGKTLPAKLPPGEEPWPTAGQFLAPWTQADTQRLGLPPEEPPPSGPARPEE
jgi:hypothetical protein